MYYMYYAVDVVVYIVYCMNARLNNEGQGGPKLLKKLEVIKNLK